MGNRTLNQLQEIFRTFFDDQSIVLTARTTARDIEEWDSLAQVGLTLSIEKKYEVRFKASEIEELENIGDMVKLICSKINQ